MTSAELTEKLASRTSAHSVDVKLFEKVRALAAKLAAVPVIPHQLRSLDYAPTYLYLEFDPEAECYREQIIVSTDGGRVGIVADLLVEWGELQLGDGALARFPPAQVAAGTLEELGGRIDAALSR